MQYFLPSRKEIGPWSIALLAAVITSLLNFQSGHSSNSAIIFARPVAVIAGVTILGLLLRLGPHSIIVILKRYAILHFLSLFATIPYFIWYFLDQEQYGAIELTLD